MVGRRSFIEGCVAGLVAAASPLATRMHAKARQPEVRPTILVFDVNETLLDVNALEPHFERAFGDGRVLREWFSTVLLYSEVATLAGPYADFGAIGRAALEMTADARGVSLSATARDGILTGLLSLPAHPDVPAALERLRDRGFQMVTLTNSSQKSVHTQLEHAKLSHFFERSFSVDTVKRFKPAPEPYRFVADELRVRTGDLRLVAAHAWDVAGAIAAGCRAAFIARPGKVLFPLAPKPDIVEKDLPGVAERVLAVDRPSA